MNKELENKNNESSIATSKKHFVDNTLVESQLLIDLQNDKSKAFDIIFNKYYKDLVLFAQNYIEIRAESEDVVQSVFLNLWNHRKTLYINTSLKSYLLKSVRNLCLNQLRHSDIRREYQKYMTEENNILSEHDTENYLLYSELHNHINSAMKKLPEKQREVFILSRFKGLKYKEISQKLNISERTVEVRISEALKTMQRLLQDFLILPLILLFFKIL